MLFFPIIMGFFLLLTIRQVNPGQTAIVFRLNKFNRMGHPGWILVLPIFESVQKINPEEKLSEEEFMNFMQVGVPPEVIDKLRKKS